MNWNAKANRPVRRRATPTLLTAVAVLLLAAGPALAQSDPTFEELLQQVGEEYALGYSSPFVHAFGTSLNSGMFHTADIPWKDLTFTFGVRGMATHLNEADQTFRSVSEVTLDDFLPEPGTGTDPYAAFRGMTGQMVLAGPTVFGDTGTNGTMTLYASGVQVYQAETIPGLADTRFVPMAAPEASVGGIAGFKGTVRYLPDTDVGDYGKFKYLGYGLQWNANGLLKDFPLEVMVGFFDQKLEVGDLIETNASIWFVGVSKDFSMLTIYGGAAKESSDMTVTYTWDDTNTGQQRDIEFSVDGVQEQRFIVGGTLNLGPLKVNGEMNHGDLTTYAAGLLIEL